MLYIESRLIDRLNFLVCTSGSQSPKGRFFHNKLKRCGMIENEANLHKRPNDKNTEQSG